MTTVTSEVGREAGSKRSWNHTYFPFIATGDFTVVVMLLFSSVKAYTCQCCGIDKHLFLARLMVAAIHKKKE